MSTQFEALQLQEVISLDRNEAAKMFRHRQLSRTVKTDEILEAIADGMADGLESALLKNGVSCEVLRLGGREWQSGRVRVRIEFCPDESAIPESPLDELRTTLSATN